MTNDKPHILIVEARFYDDLLDAMLKGAKRVLDKAGATYEIVTVPGALEIPGAIKFAHEAGNAGRLERRFDGYVAIGNGIITVENDDQAWVRAKPEDQDKGGGAAKACLTMVALKRRWGLE